MKSENVEKLVRKNEELWDLLEDLMARIQEIREETEAGLDDLEDMIAETREMRWHSFSRKVHV